MASEDPHIGPFRNSSNVLFEHSIKYKEEPLAPFLFIVFGVLAILSFGFKHGTARILYVVWILCVFGGFLQRMVRSGKIQLNVAVDETGIGFRKSSSKWWYPSWEGIKGFGVLRFGRKFRVRVLMSDESTMALPVVFSKDEISKFLPVVARFIPPSSWTNETRETLQAMGE